MEASDDEILLAQRIISSASRHDLNALKLQLQHGSANVRDPATGTTPLHAAISSATSDTEDAALKVVRLLLENGAIWNDLNNEDETPGCVALKKGLKKVYEEMVEAGVRAELLLRALANEEDEDEVDEEEVPESETTTAPKSLQETVAQHVTSADDDDVSRDNHMYLRSHLRYKPGILLDESDNAVMMDWETEIMKRHAETLIPKAGLRTMNVGHGMGIVDRAILEHDPAEHHIVEAHPQVQQRLRETGWYDKPNVHIHEGRWQDVLPKLVEQGVQLDAIYYDTFAEDYDALREFFSEWVVQLLDDNGRFGWYNGLGADRQICYDIYTKISEIDLQDAGFETQWEDIPVPTGLHGSAQWEGTRRPYWTIDVYRLPVNTFIK